MLESESFLGSGHQRSEDASSSGATALEYIPPVSQEIALARGSSSSDYTGSEDDSFLETPSPSSLVPASFRPKERQPEIKSLWQLNFHVLFYSCCAAFNSVLLGFDIGVMGGVVFIVKDLWSLNDGEVGLVMGSLQLCAIPGTFVAGYLSDKYGRTKSMCAAAVLFCMGGFILVFSTGKAGLVLGRIITGFGVGIGVSVDPLYISEISPKECRGALVTFSEIAINIGITLGYFTTWLFSSMADRDLSWRLMLSVGAVLPLIMIFLSLKVMPESPRYLMSNGQNRMALAVLQQLCQTEDEANLVYLDIEKDIKDNQNKGRNVYRNLLCDASPGIRRMVIVVIVVAVSQQLSGIDAVMGYMVFTLKDQGIESPQQLFGIQLSVGVVKTAVLVLMVNALDRKYGRRKLLFISALGCAVSHVIISLGTLDSHGGALATIGFYLYVMAFSLGLGPVTWVFCSEVLPLWARTTGIKVAVSSNRVVSALFATGFLPVMHAISAPAAFFSLACVCLLFSLFVWKYVPETKGIKLEEMEAYFNKIVSQ